MEDIIKSITEAEQQAAEIRLKAGERAAEIIAAASARAAEIAQRTEAECKIMREVQINRAVEDAQSAYDKAVAESATAARKYAGAVLKSADGAVNEILGRITGGDR